MKADFVFAGYGEHTNLLFSHTFSVHLNSIIKLQAMPDGTAIKKGE